MNGPVAETQIRRMSAADLEQILALAGSLKDAPHWPRAAYLDALNPGSAVRRIALVAVDAASGSVEGFAVVSLLASQAELEAIAVASQSQRHGVGQRLLTTMAEELRLAGVGQVRLEVRSANRPAIGLYLAFGFAEAGRRPRYYTDPIEDAVLMELQLK